MLKYWFGACILILLSSCCNSARQPYVITPCCYDQAWKPCLDEGSPIPCYYLIDPFQCTSEEGILNLQELVKLALVNSNETRISWAETRIAAAQYGEQLSAYYPEVAFKGFLSAIQHSNFLGTNRLSGIPTIQNIEVDEFRTYGPQFTLSYLIFDWGTTLKESEAFLQNVWNANWAHNRHIQTVIQQVTLDYYDLLAKSEQVNASEANLRDAETVLDATEKKHLMGISDISNILMAKTQVSKQMIQALRAEQGKENASAQLTADLGIPANTPINIQTDMDIPSYSPELCPLDQCIIQALLSRPDLFARYSKVKSSESSLKQAISDQYPKLSLDAATLKPYFNSGETSNSYDYALTLNLNFPIFKGFWYQNQIREAKSKLQKAQAEFNELEITILKDVVIYHQDFIIANKNLEVNHEYVDVAKRSYTSTLNQYNAGAVDITTVVNAFSDLANARYSLVEAKKDWFSALVNLAYATGVLKAPNGGCCP